MSELRQTAQMALQQTLVALKEEFGIELVELVLPNAMLRDALAIQWGPLRVSFHNAATINVDVPTAGISRRFGTEHLLGT